VAIAPAASADATLSQGLACAAAKNSAVCLTNVLRLVVVAI
jgi:hypothetical protein